MAPNTIIFVVFPTTTRHQCAHMTPWPIFKPVILAYFLAGGNRPRPSSRLEACILSEMPGGRAQCGHGGRAEAASYALPMRSSSGAQSKQTLTRSGTSCRSGCPAVACAGIPRRRRGERAGHPRPARGRRRGRAQATCLDGPSTGRDHVGDCGCANAGQPGRVSAAPSSRGGDGAVASATRPEKTRPRGDARSDGGIACPRVSGGTAAWWRRGVVMRKKHGSTG